MPRPRTSRLLVVAACLAVVVAAVLARPGTAVDEEQVAAVREALAPTPSVQPSSPEAPLPGGDLVVRADGVDGLRLGMGADEVAAAGYSVQRRAYGDCRRVLPGLADTGPGTGVAGWLVDDRVAAVTVDRRAGEASSFLGPGPGAQLDALPRGEGLLRTSTRQPVPWQDEPVTVDVASVAPGPGVQVAFVDLDEDGTIDHVQVLQDAAARCASAQQASEEAEAADLPVLSAEGWGELRIGMPLEEVTALVDVQTVAFSDVPPRCRLLLAEDEPGLVYVVLGADGDEADVVRAIAVDAGRTETGLRVGETADRVQDFYPGVTEAFLADRWEQGLIADWQLPGTTLRLAPAREEVPLTDVDAVIVGPRNVVGLTQLGPGC